MFNISFIKHFFFIFCIFFFSLSSQEEKKIKTIGIICYKDARVGSWDKDSIHSGIAGSEEAVIYMSDALAKLGYQVIVFANPPKNSIYSKEGSNPRYVDADSNIEKPLDVAVIWRTPWRAKDFKNKASFVYFWPHDEPCGSQQTSDILAFDDVLWISQWQRRAWICHNVAWSKFNNIFGNTILPEQFPPIEQRKNPHSCFYGSNYARGLDFLLDIWPQVREKFPDATLDIYYGWQTWGLLSPQKEAKMRKQISDYASLGVSDHGKVGHEELNTAYSKASLWTYPCSMPETFCTTAIRAQLAGAIPVIIESAALSETVPHGYKCFCKEDYLPLLLKALKEAETTPVETRKQMGDFVLKNYTSDVMAKRWAALFEKQQKELSK